MENQLWFAVISEERKGPFSEEQISTLLKAGSLSERSLVWSKEASTDEWIPLYKSGLQHLVSGAEVAPPPLPPSFAKPQDSLLMSARPPSSPATTRQSLLNQSGPELTDWGTTSVSQDIPSPIALASTQSGVIVPNGFTTKLLLFLLPPLVILTGRSLLVHFDGTSDVQARYDRFLAFSQNGGVTFIWGMVGLSFILSLFWWMHIETKNLTIRQGPQSISAAGAIYWWFVPVFNIWKPLEAMKNIVRGSVTTELDRNVMLATVWWLTTLLALLCYGISISILDSGEQLNVVTARAGLNWDLAGCILDIISSISLFFTISAVQDGHKTRN